MWMASSGAQPLPGMPPLQGIPPPSTKPEAVNMLSSGAGEPLCSWLALPSEVY